MVDGCSLATERFDLPLILRVGISNDILIGKVVRMTWAVDANSPNDNQNYINGGMEIGFFNDFNFLIYEHLKYIFETLLYFTLFLLKYSHCVFVKK